MIQKSPLHIASGASFCPRKMQYCQSFQASLLDLLGALDLVSGPHVCKLAYCARDAPNGALELSCSGNIPHHTLPPKTKSLELRVGHRRDS